MKQYLTTLFIFAVLMSSTALAEVVNWSFITGFNAQTIWRGALIWNRPLILAAPGITLFEKIRLGPGITYQEKINDHHFELGFMYINGDKPNGPVIKLSEDVPEYLYDREPAAEWSFGYHYRPKGKIHFEWQAYKEVARHYGYYLYARISQPVLPLIRLFFGRGYGDNRHNKYVYGDNAQSGFNHYDLGLSFFLPFWLKDNFLVTANFLYSKIDSGNLKSLEHIRGNNENNSFRFIAIYRFN